MEERGGQVVVDVPIPPSGEVDVGADEVLIERV
jgi:hypothetical protein